ncbi:MAG: DUF502 domain-containing protein [Hellea sp.]
MTDEEIEIDRREGTSRFKFVRWFRNRFFTGVIIALPVIATVAGVSWIVQKIDNNVLRFLPGQINPRTYLGFDIPGLGLIISFVLLVLLGIIASNFIGNSVIRAGERLLARVPVVSPIYNALKQIVTTVAQQKDRAFRDVCLLEYPRKGLYAIGFVTADLSGAPAEKLPKGYVCVFVPTTPNPTSGFLLFVKETDIEILDMTPEEGAKMIISGGMVSSNEAVQGDDPEMDKLLRKPGKLKITPPS